MAATDPERMPVIVGVGQINDRPEDPEQGLDSLGLMTHALRRAAEDAGGEGWLADLDSLATTAQISCPQLGDPTPALAQALGATPAHIHTTPTASGDGPIRLLNEAANRIGAGEAKICAVAGAEALRTAAHLTRKALAEGREPPYKPGAEVAAAAASPIRRRYGLLAPVDVYPLYEAATRAAWGQSLAEAQAETGAIWSRFAQVAAASDGAWIKRGATAEQILEAGPDNRPIAHPYLKLMVANSSVNQGAGFLVTSLAEARRRGVPEDRLIHVGAGAAGHEPADPLLREGFDASPSMAAALTKTLEFNNIETGELDHVELYSCFPCVPKMARRIIGWPEDRPATVFGGLTFGGGPIGNYMAHAVVEMVLKLRREGRLGLLFANGGFATKNHAIVVSREPIPGAAFPRDFDVQAQADAARRPAPELVEEMPGPARIESFTVLYDRKGAPRWGVVVARSLDGARRSVARIPAEDAAGIALLTDGTVEPVGTEGVIDPAGDGDQVWRR